MPTPSSGPNRLRICCSRCFRSSLLYKGPARRDFASTYIADQPRSRSATPREVQPITPARAIRPFSPCRFSLSGLAQEGRQQPGTNRTCPCWCTCVLRSFGGTSGCRKIATSETSFITSFQKLNFNCSEPASEDREVGSSRAVLLSDRPCSTPNATAFDGLRLADQVEMSAPPVVDLSVPSDVHDEKARIFG